MALYNKMRPLTLNEVKGQDKIINILKENLQNGNIPNAMLFVGTRGTGKTSVARIVARMRNCEHPEEDGSCCNHCNSCSSILAGSSLDVIELDAASNNGVDDIRSVIEQINYKPISKEKVVILDEVHMLSMGAFNALLKVLEEPPANVLFILCTTELQKIPATILSRCRKFQFDAISDDIIVEKLKNATKMYQKKAEEEALYLVAKAAKGSMRDAESIYETFLAAEGEITYTMVRDTLGFTPEENVFAVIEAIKEGNPLIATSAIEDVTEKGGSLSCLLEECFRILMDIIAVKLGGDLSGMKEEYLSKVTEYAFFFPTQRLFEIADAFKSTYEKRSSNMVFAFQAMLIGLACTQSTITQLENRVSALESQLADFFNQKATIIPDADNYSTILSTDDSTPIAFSKETDEEPNMEKSNSSTDKESTASTNDALKSAESLSKINSDALAELAAAGFTVANISEMPFEEETLDDVLPPGTQPPTNETSENIVTTTDTGNTEATEEASFFDDFARHFYF